jgi:hypothetical protein
MEQLLRLKPIGIKGNILWENFIPPIPYAIHLDIGCHLRKEFEVTMESIDYKCKVYKRCRWLDENEKIKVKDYKVKMSQIEEPKSNDYIVLYKLPCRREGLL